MLVGMENVKKSMPDDSDVLDLCCGGKRCPVMRDEGDTIAIADPDQVDGEIRLAKTDLPRVLAWLSKRSVG